MYKEISANKRRTVVIMFAFLLVVAGLAWIFGEYIGRPYVTYGVIGGSLIYALISYFSAAKMALAINRAEEVDKSSAPKFYRAVENIAITNGMPMPKVYIMDDLAPNAFASGRDPEHAVVCATT